MQFLYKRSEKCAIIVQKQWKICNFWREKKGKKKTQIFLPPHLCQTCGMYTLSSGETHRSLDPACPPGQRTHTCVGKMVTSVGNFFCCCNDGKKITSVGIFCYNGKIVTSMGIFFCCCNDGKKCGNFLLLWEIS